MRAREGAEESFFRPLGSLGAGEGAAGRRGEGLTAPRSRGSGAGEIARSFRETRRRGGLSSAGWGRRTGAGRGRAKAEGRPSAPPEEDTRRNRTGVTGVSGSVLAGEGPHSPKSPITTA